MTVSIGIKALNEETHIAAAIESALVAVAPFGGEVILADSGSSDATLAIAARYPIRIVQLADLDERCCGAGAQLAFQHADGDFFYLLDGDMVLDADFIRAGMDFLKAHPQHAAVGGRVQEMNTIGEGFRIRAQMIERTSHWQPGDVDRLDCGGLYRTQALRQIGWFADRNLHAFEEFEVAARLRVKGWKIARIDHDAVDHYGHLTGGYRLLWRRLRTGYAGAVGEVLRGALGRPHQSLVCSGLQHIRYAIMVIAWWVTLALAIAVFRSPIAFLLTLIAPVAFLFHRRRSLPLALYSAVEWNVCAIGLIQGLCRRRVSPGKPIASVTIAPRPENPIP